MGKESGKRGVDGVVDWESVREMLGEGRTLKEIGDEFGVSRQRIHQIALKMGMHGEWKAVKAGRLEADRVGRHEGFRSRELRGLAERYGERVGLKAVGGYSRLVGTYDGRPLFVRYGRGTSKNLGSPVEYWRFNVGPLRGAKDGDEVALLLVCGDGERVFVERYVVEDAKAATWAYVRQWEFGEGRRGSFESRYVTDRWMGEPLPPVGERV